MKTTLEIPPALHRKAKVKAAASKVKDQKPWMRAFGGLKHLRKETARINKLIEEEFENIEHEDR